MLHDLKIEPENISITKLPQYLPELFFKYIKEKLIKNKLWTSEDNITSFIMVIILD